MRVDTGVLFYCGIGEKKWNHHAIEAGDYVCISPVKGRTKRTLRANDVPKEWLSNIKIIQDSGAFQDTAGIRLSFQAALERQINHAAKYNYAANIEYRVSYDRLIDEKVQDGVRVKRRWSVAEGKSAVTETIATAQYLADNRHGLNLILSAQGVDAKQYMQCVKPVIDCMDMARDTLGLGGWCIIGTRPKQMMPVFRETIRQVIPYAAKQGVKRVHIFGVIYPGALGELLWMCDQHNIKVSTDSTSPANHPFRGQWGYGSWRDNSYRRVDVTIRGLERARHVALTRAYLAQLANEPEYQEPLWIPHKRQRKIKMRQLALPFAS